MKNTFIKYSGTSLQWTPLGPQKMFAIERCPVQRSFSQIGTCHPYSPIGLSLLKMVKSLDQRRYVMTTPYI